MSGKRKRTEDMTAYLYLLPATILVGVFFISSVGFTLYLSFFEWDGFSPMRFVGVTNYRMIFSDANIQLSILNTLIWVASSLVISFAIPLIMAILICNSSFLSFYKYVFYLPNAFSGTVGGLIIASLLSINGVPRLLGFMGFPELVKDWLAVPYLNTFTMITSGLWQGIGLNMALFIVGLLSMPSSPIEAAVIDGANTLQKYCHVVLPLLRSTSLVVIVMSLGGGFKVFEGLWVMTKGGPFRSSETMALTMYVESFIYNHLGVGAAVAVVLSAVIMLISYTQLRASFSSGANA
jgi:multiple sugar transport system permease protein